MGYTSGYYFVAIDFYVIQSMYMFSSSLAGFVGAVGYYFFT